MAVSKQRLYAAAALLVTAAALGAGLFFGLAHGAEEAGAGSASSATRFSIVEGEVRVRRHETREVVRADADTTVRPGDLVETLETGRAVIKMADGSTLEISPNSVVTVSENAGAREHAAPRVRVAVGRGRVEVNTEQLPAEASNTVETRLTKNRLAARTDASFHVLDDRSEELRVGAGSVVSETPGGRTVIGPEEHVALGSAGEVRRREPLLDTPVLYEPPHAARIVASGGAEKSVMLQWTRPLAKTAVTYRVEIAASPFFVRSGVLFERAGLTDTRLVVTGLASGNYYWRARSASRTGQESEWTRPQKFTVVGEHESPRQARHR